jgi:hypothetical protein
MQNPLIIAKAAILGLFQTVSTHGNTGLIGKPLAVVQQKSDLFVFFNFAPIGKKTSNGTTVTSFKPTGDAFRPLVTLEVTTCPRDAIQVLRLFVSRSFIDDRKQSIYAADLVKSFLGNAEVSSPADDIARLAREISARAMAGSPVPILTVGPNPQAPSQISAAYHTYSGTGSEQTVANAAGSVQVSIRNEIQNSTPVLELVMSAIASK